MNNPQQTRFYNPQQQQPQQTQAPAQAPQPQQTYYNNQQPQAPQPQAKAQYPQQPAAQGGQQQFIQYSSMSYYDNRGTTDRQGRQQDTQVWDIRFNFDEAVAMLAQLQAAVQESEGRGVVVRFTTGRRGSQKYESGGFSIKPKKERQAQQGPTQYVPRNNRY